MGEKWKTIENWQLAIGKLWEATDNEGLAKKNLTKRNLQQSNRQLIKKKTRNKKQEKNQQRESNCQCQLLTATLPS